MTTPLPEPRIHVRDECMVLASWGNLLVTDIRGSVRSPHIQEMARTIQSMVRIYPRGLVSLTLLAGTVPIGDAETRDEARHSLASTAPSLRQIVIVLEGRGIWAATMRTTLRALGMLARGSMAMRVHDEIGVAARELAAMMAESSDLRPTERDLIDALAKIRSRRS